MRARALKVELRPEPPIDEISQKTCKRPCGLVQVVDNTYFGHEVTVSGLLTGVDLIRTLRDLPADVQDVVLPRGPFGFDGRCTLDGVSAEQVGDAHPGRVHLASTPAELLGILNMPASRTPAFGARNQG